MKTAWVFAAAFLATAWAAPVMDITAIVTRDCTPTPTPQSMSGYATLYPAATVQDCQQRCLATQCVGFAWQAPSACTLFSWIITSFDTTDLVSSYRCRAQLVQENGNLPGLDLATVSTPTADQCSYKCEATRGCYAYSWSSANGGSCFLKSDKPSTLSEPYDGSVVSGEVYKCSTPHMSANLEGTDLASAPAPVWSDCCAICRRQAGCDGFTWTDYNGGTCWLKTKVTINNLNFALGQTSALMFGNAATTGKDTCTETDGPLVFAGTTREYNVMTPADCRELCLMSDCAAFAFHEYGCSVSDWFGIAVKAARGRSWRCRSQLPRENGNYVGLAVDNAPTQDADRCSYQCDATPNCWAYSWTKANNGTCWMKSNKPTTLSAPFDGSAVSGEVYKCTPPQYDLDVVGDDLPSVQRPVWSDCCGVCRRTTGCEAFSWSSYNSGTCWLKTKVVRGKSKPAPGIVSAHIFTTAASKVDCPMVQSEFQGDFQVEIVAQGSDCEKICLFQNCVGFEWDPSDKFTCRLYTWITSATAPPTGYTRQAFRCRTQLPQEKGDYAGSDLANVPAATATQCSYTCEETAGCYGYSWSNYNGGTCYMKTSKPTAITGPSDGSVISGEVLKCQHMETNYDTDGGDLGSVGRELWPECAGVCRRTSGCKAFSWSSYNGGTCWLKASAGTRKYAPGVVAAEL